MPAHKRAFRFVFTKGYFSQTRRMLLFARMESDDNSLRNGMSLGTIVNALAMRFTNDVHRK